MNTSYLDSKGIKFEIANHAEIKTAGVAGAAATLNCPKDYIVSTYLYDLGGRIAAVYTGGGITPVPEAVAAAFDAPSATPVPHEKATELTGLAKLDINPLTIADQFESIWETSLFDFPYIVFSTFGATESIKVDTREFIRAGFRAAAVIPPQPAPGSAFETLLRRGFIDRVTDEELANKMLSGHDSRCYIGFDPTADSLHVGSLVPIMALVNIQRYGLRPIALVGGATALVGDPSGKTEMRKMLTRDQINENARSIAAQLSRYISFDGDTAATLVNNADWLAGISYIDYLREVGVHFSVNRMIKMECFATRMEKGLSFIEFNYMLMQAYDFTHLAETHNCYAQLGGSDQWGNICAGKDLGHRVKGLEVFGREMTRTDLLIGVTFPLLKNASGGKFGKTEGGNVWLDPARSSHFDFFQFWRNADDADVRRLLGLFTTIHMDDVRRLTSGKTGSELNLAKQILAFAATCLTHGIDAAFAAAATARDKFGGYGPEFTTELAALSLATPAQIESFAAGSGAKADIPTINVTTAQIAEGITIVNAMRELGLVASNGEARRLIAQNGVRMAGTPVTSHDTKIPGATPGESIEIRLGKKKYGRVAITD